MSPYATAAKAFSVLLPVLALCLTAGAAPEISNRSPDKKFALWQEYADKQPYLGEVKLVEAPSGNPVVTLDTQVEPFRKKLLWSKDSQRFAYFNDGGANGTTRIFYRSGSSFDEIKLPPLPALPQPPSSAPKGEDTKTRTRVAPIRWTDAGKLVVENELISNDWGRSAAEVTLAIDSQHQASVAKAEEEPKSVLDYFLLLPAKDFEGPPSIWLAQIRDSKSGIDKKNGFMHSGGDGAQPEFEVALFRYRDGRPLLALCNGELEGDDDLYLQFFELAPNGRMEPVNHWMFPVPDGGYDPDGGGTKTDWEFHLPHSGKTIVIKTHKGHKTLYKLTWNGEKFEKGK